LHAVRAGNGALCVEPGWTRESPPKDDQARAARQQRLQTEGHDDAGDAVLAGRQAAVLAAYVSDDNAYAESLFRTAEYRPEFPAKDFADLDAARAWAAEFVRW